MEYTEKQVEKLPKWAQSLIKGLEQKESHLTKLLAEYNSEIESNTLIRDGFDKKQLPNNSVVEFMTGHNNANKVTVYVRRDGFIDVNTDSILGQNMVILPRASNSFYITFVD